MKVGKLYEKLRIPKSTGTKCQTFLNNIAKQCVVFQFHANIHFRVFNSGSRTKKLKPAYLPTWLDMRVFGAFLHKPHVSIQFFVIHFFVTSLFERQSFTNIEHTDASYLFLHSEIKENR